MKTKLLAASAIATSLILVAGCGNSDASNDTKKRRKNSKNRISSKT
ncbi:hypothetical protein [Listeria rocourtiae]|nr:hypothetical protein [Listeria rocourtiae]